MMKYEYWKKRQKFHLSVDIALKEFIETRILGTLKEHKHNSADVKLL